MHTDQSIDSGSNKPESKPIKDILVVEDTKSIQMVYRSQLTRGGYSFDLAVNGKAALSAFDKMRYRLILLDVGLPDIDGKDICRRLRRDSGLGHCYTPIIMLSAAGELMRQECINAGADDFFVKTVVATKTLQKIIAYYLSSDIE